MATQKIDANDFDKLELVPILKAAEALYVSRKTLDRAIKKSLIMAYKPNGKTLIDMVSAKQWFLTHCVLTPVEQKKRGAPRRR